MRCGSRSQNCLSLGFLVFAVAMNIEHDKIQAIQACRCSHSQQNFRIRYVHESWRSNLIFRRNLAACLNPALRISLPKQWKVQATVTLRPNNAQDSGTRCSSKIMKVMFLGSQRASGAVYFPLAVIDHRSSRLSSAADVMIGRSSESKIKPSTPTRPRRCPTRDLS